MSMSVRCKDGDAMLGVVEPCSPPPTQARAQRLPQPMEIDLAPSLSRSSSRSPRSVSPEFESNHRDLNRKLIYPSSPRSRHQRPQKLSPQPDPNPDPRPPFAISGSYNNNYYNSQNVRPSLVNASSASYQNNISAHRHQHVPRPTPPESNRFQSSPSENVSINHHHNRPRTSNQVFHSTSDLAAHYGIPTFLPPAPRTTPRRISVDSQHQQQNASQSEPEFAHLCSNYLTMLSQNPGETNNTASMAEDPVTDTATSAHDSAAATAFPPVGSQEAAVQALMDVFQASPELQNTSDFSEYLTSPFDDSPFDDDLLATPAMDSGNMSADILTSPIMDWSGHGDTYRDQPLFSGEGFDEYYNSPIIEKPPVDNTPAPTIDISNMWTMTPPTPALSSFDSPSVSSDKPLPPSRRKASATGTRKNVTPETLVPVDAPTQPRKYTTPSATSRKDVPAIFARKRARSQAFGDEEDQLEDELMQLPPNPTEQELIEAKRRQNTIAARRSRKRKLEYQRELEDSIELLKEERDMWKSKALTYQALLKSHGVNAADS